MKLRIVKCTRVWLPDVYKIQKKVLGLFWVNYKYNNGFYVERYDWFGTLEQAQKSLDHIVFSRSFKTRSKVIKQEVMKEVK